MQSQGVDWWGYAEGTSVAVGVLMVGTVLFAVAYLVRPLVAKRASAREAAASSERRGRRR